MSITGDNGWNEVEARARQHESAMADAWAKVTGLPLVTITTEDRLRGAVVEALSQLEQGHNSAAWQILNDSLKIGGVK